VSWEREFTVGWAQLDANNHMANTAFLDVAVDVRFGYFASRGMPVAEFNRLRVGPVVRRDEVDYFRELRFMERFRVNLLLAGLAEDASRFRIVNEFRRGAAGGEDEVVARIASQGGWLDLEARRLVVPPDALAAALRDLDRTEGFEVLPSSIKRAG
jgi:acyl-CoA thioester hydrolase